MVADGDVVSIQYTQSLNISLIQRLERNNE